DRNPRLAAYFGISAIPAIKVIYRGQLVHEFEGLLPEPALRQFFDEIAGPSEEGDPAVHKARAAEEAAPARAEKLYREMIAKEPEKHEARGGLARVLLRLGRLDEIAEVLEPVGTSGELGAEAEGILARVWLLKNAEALPDEKALRKKAA